VIATISLLFIIFNREFFFVNGYLYKVSKFGYDDPLGSTEDEMLNPAINGKKFVNNSSETSYDDEQKKSSNVIGQVTEEALQ
jgi:hypothetical protein